MKILKNGIEINNIFYSLEEIIKQVLIKKIEEEKLCLLTIEYEVEYYYVKETICGNIEDLEWLKSMLLYSNFYFKKINKISFFQVYLKDEEYFKTENNIDKVYEFLKLNPEGHLYTDSFLYSLRNQLYESLEDIEETIEFKIEITENITRLNNILNKFRDEYNK